MSYLDAVLERNLPVNGVFVGRFVKPIPYFFPVLETIERALNTVTMNGRRAIVTVDGIDRKKAAELTSALRIRGLRLEFVRSARDESEPIIRLADMWSGCVRAAFLGDGEAKLRYIRAVECGYLNDITK